MPWRKTHNPYAILVSEVMLQQTQVDRVAPYFERWMRKFPTPQKLAAADLHDVLKEWSGLGYNRRGKFLHDAGKVIVARGDFPREYEELRKLPGVGDYTAKAVRVFAFNEPEVLIETNVRAAFLHHFFPQASSVPDSKLLPLIAQSIKKQDPRTWYAALMDYGTHLKSVHPNPSRRSKHHVRQSKFAGSLREVRGAIVRAVTKGKKLTEIKKRYVEQFEDAYQSLIKDGLINQSV